MTPWVGHVSGNHHCVVSICSEGGKVLCFDLSNSFEYLFLLCLLIYACYYICVLFYDLKSISDSFAMYLAVSV